MPSFATEDDMAATVCRRYRRHGNRVGSDTGTTSGGGRRDSTTTPSTTAHITGQGFHFDRLQHDIITDFQDADAVVVAGGHLQQLIGDNRRTATASCRHRCDRCTTARYRGCTTRTDRRCRIQCTERTSTQADYRCRGRLVRLLLLLGLLLMRLLYANYRTDWQCRRTRLARQDRAATGNAKDLWRLLKNHVACTADTATSSSTASTTAAAAAR